MRQYLLAVSVLAMALSPLTAMGDEGGESEGLRLRFMTVEDEEAVAQLKKHGKEDSLLIEMEVNKVCSPDFFKTLSQGTTGNLSLVLCCSCTNMYDAYEEEGPEWPTSGDGPPLACLADLGERVERLEIEHSEYECKPASEAQPGDFEVFPPFIKGLTGLKHLVMTDVPPGDFFPHMGSLARLESLT